MSRRTRWLALGALVVAGGLYAAYMLRRPAHMQHFTAVVERGNIDDVVEATGTINAVITVQVGSQVSGTIAKLNVDFNSHVRKGDIVALIDPALFKGALLQADADLGNARANLLAARANADKARANLVQTKADYDRNVNLFRERIASQQQLDTAKAAFDSANASVEAANANIVQAEAVVRQKTAAVAVAQTNVDYTVIRSPIDGTVVARNVDVGQTVAASLQAPTIFTIAQDLTKMWVYAKTDESDVGNIRIGAPVTFKVDAFPKDTFHGVVNQVRMNATMVQSVVTYDTIIEFANPEQKLFPGMTAYVTIPVATARDVLKMPNTALRYKPPLPVEEIAALYRQQGITVSEEVAPADAAVHVSQDGSTAAPPVPHSARSETAVVWRLGPDNSLEPAQIVLGITDHAFTEVRSVVRGNVREGDAMVIRSVAPRNQAPTGMPR
jgi:HlyD family secretion protein